jgi:AbrB family looped-hinge helix DNA binding protein
MQPTTISYQPETIITVTRKGQITLPAHARRLLNTEKNLKLAVAVEPDGSLTLKPPTYPTLESLAGIIPPLDPPKTWEEVQAIIAEERAEAYLAKQR